MKKPKKYYREQIIDYFDGMYACGEWCGESPERDFRKLRTLYRKYNKAEAYESNDVDPREQYG